MSDHTTEEFIDTARALLKDVRENNLHREIQIKNKDDFIVILVWQFQLMRILDEELSARMSVEEKYQGVVSFRVKKLSSLHNELTKQMNATYEVTSEFLESQVFELRAKLAKMKRKQFKIVSSK